MELVHTEPTKYKILWAVDALSPEPEMESHGLDWVLSFTRGFYDEVEPVFVFDEVELNSPDTHLSIDEQLKKITSESHLPHIKKPRVISDIEPPFFSEPKLVDSLLSYAGSSNTGLIVTHSTSRRSLKKLIIGSFAESLIDHSAIPLLLLSRVMAKARPIKKLGCLFDGSAQSQLTLLTVLNQSKRLNAEVRILEAQPTLTDRLFHSTPSVEDPRFFFQALEKAASDFTRLISHRILPEGMRLADGLRSVILPDQLDLIALPRPSATSIVGFPWDFPPLSEVPVWIP